MRKLELSPQGLTAAGTDSAQSAAVATAKRRKKTKTAGSTAMTLNDTKTNKTIHFLRQVIIYTLLFIVIAAVVYFAYISDHKTLIRYYEENKDGLAQRYMFLFEFKRFLEGFISGDAATWDWSIGLGEDSYVFNAANIFNPLSYFVILFPAKYMDIAYSINVIIRVYLSGFAFLLFGRKVRLTDLQGVAGSISYTFCPWILITSASQGQFVLGPVMLPFVLLGVEKVLKGESPVCFMIMVAYTMLTSFQWSYIIGIIIIPYFIIRYITDYRGGSVGFARRFVLFIIYGLVGIITSAMVFIMTIVRYTGATFDSKTDIPALFSAADYMRLPSTLTSWASFFNGTYSFMGVNAICIVMIPVIIYCAFKKKAPAIITMLLIALACIPVVSSVFNFFGYISGRWFFVIVFFFVWAAVECLDEKYMRKPGIKVAIVATALLYAVYMIWYRDKLGDISLKVAFINCLATGFLILILLVKYSKSSVKKINIYRVCSVAAIAVISIGIMGAGNIKLGKDVDKNLTAGDAESLIRSSVQRIAAGIEDNDFYRVDQAEGVYERGEIQSKVNETMYFGTRSIYEFTSSIDAGWLEYNKMLGNSQGYYKRTSPNSNDNRSGMDLLLGVKYFIGDDDNGTPGASDYAGYGFSKYDKIDGVDLLKNKYSIGLGAVYDKYITRSEWEKLSPYEREQAMLQAAFVDDGYESSEVSSADAGDMETIVKEIPCEISATDTGSFNKEKETASITEESGKLHVSTGEIKNSQVIVVLEGLGLLSSGEERGVRFHVSDGDIIKSAANTRGSNQGLYDIDDFSACMGYVKSGSKEFDIDFEHAREYTLKDIKVYAMDMDLYEKYAKNLQKNRLTADTVKNGYVHGTVNSDNGGILYLSILDDNGWDIYIDGNKTDKIDNVNIAFTGVKVTAGEHDVEMIYHTPWLMTGIIVTIIGILLIIAVGIAFRRRSKFRDNNARH